MDFNKKMRLFYYDSGEVEVNQMIHEGSKQVELFGILFFRNVDEFIELIKTNPKLAKELKERLK